MKNCKLEAMLLMAVLLSNVPAFAYGLWLNDVEYTLYDWSGTAKVNVASKDINTIVIPGKITYNGKDYTVTSIGSRAFYG